MKFARRQSTTGFQLSKKHPVLAKDPDFIALVKDDIFCHLNETRNALLVSKDSLAHTTISYRMAFSLGKGMKTLDPILKKSVAMYNEDEKQTFILGNLTQNMCLLMGRKRVE